METSFSSLSDDIVRFKIEMGVLKKCTKMSTPFPMDFLLTPQHAVVIDDVIIIGRRRVYCASTLLGRCLCKRVDVYVITLSCTWRIYALSERLLVLCCFYVRQKVMVVCGSLYLYVGCSTSVHCSVIIPCRGGSSSSSLWGLQRRAEKKFSYVQICSFWHKPNNH